MILKNFPKMGYWLQLMVFYIFCVLTIFIVTNIIIFKLLYIYIIIYKIKL